MLAALSPEAQGRFGFQSAMLLAPCTQEPPSSTCFFFFFFFLAGFCASLAEATWIGLALVDFAVSVLAAALGLAGFAGLARSPGSSAATTVAFFFSGLAFGPAGSSKAEQGRLGFQSPKVAVWVQSINAASPSSSGAAAVSVDAA